MLRILRLGVAALLAVGPLACSDPPFRIDPMVIDPQDLTLRLEDSGRVGTLNAYGLRVLFVANRPTYWYSSDTSVATVRESWAPGEYPCTGGPSCQIGRGGVVGVRKTGMVTITAGNGPGSASAALRIE